MNDISQQLLNQPAENTIILEEMAKAGVLYGRKKTKTHPKMRVYIQTTRNGVEIFDLNKTLEALEKAKEFLKEIISKGGQILLVGTQPAAKEAIKNLAEKFNFPYVNNRWLGGTLTNFKTLSLRIAYFIKLKADRAAGKLEKYTKKERLNFDREIARMEKFFGSLEKLNKLPEALLIVDTAVKNHKTAVREANRLKIPIIAIINSDANPEEVLYPIPANASARSSIVWILEKIEKAIEEARSQSVNISESINKSE